MRYARNDRPAYGQDSIEAELRGAYERGRREQRDARRGGAVRMLFMLGSAAAGAMLVYLAFNRGVLPMRWRAPHGSSSPPPAGLTVVSDPSASPIRTPQAIEDVSAKR